MLKMGFLYVWHIAEVCETPREVCVTRREVCVTADAFEARRVGAQQDKKTSWSGVFNQ